MIPTLLGFKQRATPCARIVDVGAVLPDHVHWFQPVVVGADRLVRVAHGRQPMSGIELVGLVVATGLMGYLMVAFLKPEWFS